MVDDDVAAVGGTLVAPGNVTVPAALATTTSPSSPGRLKSIAIGGLWLVRVAPIHVCPHGNGTSKSGVAGRIEPTATTATAPPANSRSAITYSSYLLWTSVRRGVLSCGCRKGATMAESNERETDVAIIGAGPAGLVLAHLLAARDIDCVVLEQRDREYVEHRVRAGVLEHPSVELLRQLGLADRLTARASATPACSWPTKATATTSTSSSSPAGRSPCTASRRSSRT